MNPATEVLEHASVKQYCKALRVPVIGANFVSLAEQNLDNPSSIAAFVTKVIGMGPPLR